MALPFLTVIARQAVYEIYRRASLLNVVNRDFSADIAQRGETVSVILPETPTVQDAGGAFRPNAATPSVVNVTLDKWRETAPIYVNMASIAKADRDVLAQYATPIANSLLADVEAAILTEIATTSLSMNAPTSGGVVPIGAEGIGIEIKLKFDSILSPLENRFVLAGPSIETEYWNVFGTSATDSTQQMIAGELGKKFGLSYLSVPAAEVDSIIGYGVQKNAVALVSRPMQPSPLAQNTMATAEYNGLGITVEMWHDPATSNDYIKGQLLYGVKTVTGKMFAIGKLGE